MKPSKRLIKKWYDILEEDGFKDIEYFDDSMEPKDVMFRECGKQISSWINNYESTEQFYINLRRMLNVVELKEKDRTILSLYSDGLSYRKIASVTGIGYHIVCKTINAYKDTIININTLDKEENG